MHKPTFAAAVTIALLAAGPTAAGQDQPQSSAQSSSAARSAPDFLFGRPHGSLGVRGAWLFARADSDLFDFVEHQLTIDKKDFNAPGVGIDFGLALTPRIDVAFNFDFNRTGKESEYRGFVDNRNLPINQRTTLTERNMAGSVRFNLLPRGQSVSRFAWVPRGVTPYAGAGAGALWYRFAQSGDFVDYVDLSVFTDSFSSSGFTPSAHVFGGADVHLYRILFLTFEGRYLWANAKLGKDFIDFDPIDLAGFRLSTGVHVLF